MPVAEIENDSAPRWWLQVISTMPSFLSVGLDHGAMFPYPNPGYWEALEQLWAEREGLA